MVGVFRCNKGRFGLIFEARDVVIVLCFLVFSTSRHGNFTLFFQDFRSQNRGTAKILR